MTSSTLGSPHAPRPSADRGARHRAARHARPGRSGGRGAVRRRPVDAARGHLLPAARRPRCGRAPLRTRPHLAPPGADAGRRRRPHPARDGRRAVVPARPRPPPAGDRGDRRRHGRARQPRRPGARGRGARGRRPAVRRRDHLSRHAAHRARPDDAQRPGRPRDAGHGRPPAAHHAGAVRRVHVVPGQRPAVGQGALRRHGHRAARLGRRQQRPTGLPALDAAGRPPPASTWRTRRRAT